MISLGFIGSRKPARLQHQKLAFAVVLKDDDPMSDINKRGPDCDNEEGERGERGERGRRGHRGHRGHDGSTGPTGPTGSQGATGPSGSDVAPAYGYAVADEQQTVNPNTDVVFNLGGTPFPNVGITPPAPGGTTFVVLTDGDYEYNFYVAGSNFQLLNPLVFEIFLDGSAQGPAHTFRSNLQPVDPSQADLKVCRGQGIISIVAGTSVTLRNANIDVVTLQPQVQGDSEMGITTANATLSLKKLSP